MLFNSIDFSIFFLIVTSLYFILPHKWRWLMLLLASCYFYMSFIPVYILVLAATILIDYYAGILMAKSEGRKRKLILVASILSTCLVLFVFKYFNFFNANLENIASFFHWNYGIESLRIILPIGLSFHTFQSLSYVIEVYYGRQKVERNFGVYALYVMFYPQLVAGPIERPQNLLHQFYEKHFFDYKRVTDGLKIMLWGFFLKMVIADRLGMPVDQVYGNLGQYSGFSILLASYFFAFQIYCDFAGYSFIAIGASKVMGFSLMENFRRPYFSRSISEFWKRWHISLSTWFRDYVYIPLGGNRVRKYRWFLNLFVVFLISGLWHGAGWTFVIWGALHGGYLIISILTKNVRDWFSLLTGIAQYPKFHNLIKMFITFHLVVLGWIFFRANSVSEAFYILKKIAGMNIVKLSLQDFFSVLPGPELMVAVLSILFMEFIHLIQERVKIIPFLDNKTLIFRWSLYSVIILAILIFGVFEKRNFIYFQF